MSDELKNYNIYAGLGGSFGGAKYVGTLKKGSKGIFVTLWQCLLLA